MKYVYGLLILALNACTFSIIVMDTHGPATDMVDEAQTANPAVTLPLPVK